MSKTNQKKQASIESNPAGGTMSEEEKSIGLADVCDVCYMNGSCNFRYIDFHKSMGKPNVLSDCPRKVFRELKARPKSKKFTFETGLTLGELNEYCIAAYEIAKRPADAVKEIKLFSAFSIFEEFAGRENVRLNWFYLNRAKPIGLYDELIQGFYGFEKDEQDKLSRQINELFTEEEVKELSASIACVNVNFVYEQVLLPIGQDENPGFEFEHYTNHLIGTLKGHFMPMKNDNWKLPVPVWASFDLNHAKMSEEVADKAHQMGKYLMQKLMTAQSIDPTFIDEIVEKKIAGLYDIYEHYRHCGEIFLTEIELQKMACTFRPTMWQNYS